MLKGKPAGESDAVTMEAIRAVMIQHDVDALTNRHISEHRTERTPLRAVDPSLAQSLQPVRDVEAKINLAKFTTVPDGDAGALNARADLEASRVAQAKGLWADAASAPQFANMPKRSILRLMTPRNLAIAVMFGLAMIQPGFLIFGLLGLIATPILAFILFGPDRFWNSVAQGLNRFEKRSPKRAVKVMEALDTIAVHWDAVLDRFPERWVSGLYMPDFAVYEDIQRVNEERVDDRLARMHSQV